MADRRVHATGLGFEVVRYNRAGRWYVENSSGCKGWYVQISHHPDDRVVARRTTRARTSVREAARLSVFNGFRITLDLPGGGAFDRYVRMARGARA